MGISKTADERLSRSHDCKRMLELSRDKLKNFVAKTCYFTATVSLGIFLKEILHPLGTLQAR